MVIMIFSGSDSYCKDTYDSDEYEATVLISYTWGGKIAFQILKDTIFFGDKAIYSK